MSNDYYVYIMTNRFHNVLYVGVTNNLSRRVQEHKIGDSSGFSKKYNINKLVYYEHFNNIEFAIEREKQIKGGSRARKIKLILEKNPGWIELDVD